MRPEGTYADDDVETVIMAVWAEVLGLPAVRPDDDFFHLGGHSVQAGRVVTRLRSELSVDLPLSCLFDASTVDTLAAYVRELREDAAPDEPASHPAATRYPASSAQRRQLFLHRMDPDSTAYTVAEVVTVTGPLDLAALGRAGTELVRRHDVLRTRYESGQDGLVAVVCPPEPLPLPVDDLSGLPATERAAAVGQATALAAATPFDLAAGPPLRVRVLRLEPTRHVVVVTVHHIATDGWSMALFWDELGNLYGAYADGRSSPLPELPARYADYAAWQNERAGGDEYAGQLAFWRHVLRDAPAVLAMPADRPRPAKQSHRGAQIPFAVPDDMVPRLRALGAAHRATLFMTLLAVFDILLSRLTGQPDLSVGTPIAGRGRREWEGLIGFFVNTLVIRVDLSGDPSFADVLGRVRQAALGAFANQDLPFERLVADLAPERTAAHNPLFQVMFVLHNAAAEQVRMPGLLVDREPVDVHSAKFDLKLLLTERGDRLDGHLEYSSDLFDSATADRLVAQYLLLLEQVLTDPDRTMYSYSLCTPGTADVLPDPSAPLDVLVLPTVPEMFGEWALRAPDAPAVRHRGGVGSYRALHAAAVGIARALVTAGVRPGGVVAVSGPRCFGLVASMLGVLFSGGVLLPIDPALPERRRALLLREGGAGWFVHCTADRAGAGGGTDAGNGADMGAGLPDGHVLAVRADTAEVAGPTDGAAATGDGPVLPELAGAGPAYILFTSGTTGTPKAVVGSHQGISHFVRWEREAFGIGPGDRFAQLTSLSFDPVLRDLFVPLASGATVCLPDPEVTRPPAVLDWLRAERVTVLHVVPSVARWWLADVPQGTTVDSLRHVLFAGEPLSGSLLARWRLVFARAAVANLYGPTETTQSKCFARILEPEPGIQPIGRPLPQTQALVLNRAGQLCGPGELGEIVIRTPYRTLGYLDPVAEEGRRFAVNPFGANADDVVYHTGDLGRYRGDGTLEIAGRVDEQVKIRGVRIEPAEVTAVLDRQDGVEACCVVARSDDTGRTGLVGYVVPARDRQPTAEGLIRALSQELPTAMIPGRILFLPALPLTANGKLDRDRLPALPAAPPDGGVRPPGNLTEEIMARLFGAVLRAEPASVDDSFFVLGGDSMSATLLVTRIRETFGVDPGVNAVFEAQTVAGLSALVAELSRRQRSAPVPARPSPVPLRRRVAEDPAS